MGEAQCCRAGRLHRQGAGGEEATVMTRAESGGQSGRTMTPAGRHGHRWQERTEGRRSRGEAVAAGRSERAKDGRPWQRPGRAQG